MVVQESFSYREGMAAPLKNDKKHRLKQRFDVHKKLGQGTYGKVQLAVNKETGQEVAIKTIKKVKIESEQDLIRIRREIQIMSSIQHPHIIHIYEVFENKDKIVLVMQFASGGELYDYLSEKKVLSDTEARRIFRQIAAAIYYCHKNKICHRDLKLENILLDEKGNAKIADFGLSNVYDERHLLTTYCGSPLYASPEIVKGVPYYGPEVDCWSMGVLLYTLVYGAMPFDGSNFKKLVTQISEGDYFEPKKKSKASTLIHKLLTVNPAKRATIVDICTDWWVNQGYEHSLLQVAEDMANLTPVRLDLLLALSPVSPVPPEEASFQEQQALENLDDNLTHDGLVPESNVHDDEEEDDDDEDNPETAVNSFAYVKGSCASNLSASSPNLQHVDDRLDDEDSDEFLPSDIAAALQNQCVKRAAEKSFDGSLVRISSLAHQSKKPRKSESSQKEILQIHTDKPAVSNESVQEKEKQDDENANVLKENHEMIKSTAKLTGQDKSETAIDGNVSAQEKKDSSEPEKSNKNIPKEDLKKKGSNCDIQKSSIEILKHDNSSKQLSSETHLQKQETDLTEKDLAGDNNQAETNFSKVAQRTGSFTTQDDALTSESKKTVRYPGKITIPKSFDSQQQSPSPKAQVVKKIMIDKSKSGEETCSNKIESNQKYIQTGVLHKKEDLGTSQSFHTGNVESKKEDIEDKNKKVHDESLTDTKFDVKSETIGEEKKVFAKGILKKGIAKAKLAERKMSQQSSFESEVATPSSPSIGTPEITGPSFFKTPKPYFKENDNQVESKAEIVLTPPINKPLENPKRDEAANNQNESIWDAPLTAPSSERQLKLLKNKNLNWHDLSSTLDSEMSDWREQMEESLRRLSPDEDEEKSTSSQSCVIKSEDDKPLVPIARSYKKFTFTKDGACITETKKIYETPGADGSWTKVEKKTKITTRPGNAEEFEKFRDLHLRNDSPLVRSDSQSSSGSTDIFDDIFDSWTGDSMLCNMMKMKNVFHKFSRDPFLRKERRRNPFRQFQRTESERNERMPKRAELKSVHSTDKESSDNEEDYDVHFDGSNPVVYGSQGLWQLLRSANKGFPDRITVSHHQPFEKLNYSRSVSQERPESKLDNWKRSESRTTSGYNTGTRSQSRDRTESPREKVLRFVFESPKQQKTSKVFHSGSPPSRLESWSFKRSSSQRNPRRDSGVGSDGYESEHSLTHTPSDDPLKTGTVSPLTSIYGTSRPDIFQNFMKSWPKDGPSTSLFPSSLQEDSPDEQSDNLAESRRHRVEQWLHMSDIKNSGFPLDFNSDSPHSKTSAMRSPNVMRNDQSSLYGTMRPREYMKYNRSVSDKMPDYDLDCFPTFEDSQRSRSIHNLHNKEQGFEGVGGKVRARAAVYSPVSEESSRETQSLYRSDSSHSASSVHRINFTISDGRISSSHTPAHSSTKYVNSFSGSLDGQPASGKSSGNISVEQVPSRGIGQPVVQMRVSFNRGSRDNQVIHVTSQPQQQMSKGLWQQQEHETSRPVLRQDFSNPNREGSPLPGIRKFSTEMVHPVSSVSDSHDSTVTSEMIRARHVSVEKPARTTSLEYEINNIGTGISKRGKNAPFTSSPVLDENPLNACSLPCMDTTVKITNPNNQSCSQSAVCAGVCPERLAKELKTVQCIKEIASDDHLNSEGTTKDYLSNGANTPDSLEETCGRQNIVKENEFIENRYKKEDVQMQCGTNYPLKSISNAASPCDDFHLEIKPLGVLWDNCKQNLVHRMKQEEESNTNFNNDYCESPLNEKPQDCISENFCIVESIAETTHSANRNSKILNTRNSNEWTDKETKAFDLLKNLPDESSLSSTRCLLKSTPISISQNETASQQVISFQDSSHKTSASRNCSFPQSVFDDRISLICEFETEEKHRDRFQRMLPTLMDDLQSPKEVLRQAMRLCESFDS